jgi:hypothetical protein
VHLGTALDQQTVPLNQMLSPYQPAGAREEPPRDDDLVRDGHP